MLVTMAVMNSPPWTESSASVDYDSHAVSPLSVCSNWQYRTKSIACMGWFAEAMETLTTLKAKVQNSAVFWKPVREVQDGARYYSLVCPLPMDFGTIWGKLDKRAYSTLDDFLRDCELVFINARLYNPPEHQVHKSSLCLETQFKLSMDRIVTRYGQNYGSAQTLRYWKKAKDDHRPFAVPVDEGL